LDLAGGSSLYLDNKINAGDVAAPQQPLQQGRNAGSVPTAALLTASANTTVSLTYQVVQAVPVSSTLQIHQELLQRPVDPSGPAVHRGTVDAAVTVTQSANSAVQSVTLSASANESMLGNSTPGESPETP